MAYTAEQVDELIATFDKCAAKVAANQSSAVKLRAAERDLLACAEKARDLCLKAVKGTKAEDRELLRSVFGTEGCKRFHRFKAVLDTVVFSDMHATDQRWSGLKAAIETIEEVLKQMGLFKPWQIGAQAPDDLAYKGVRGRYSPGEKVKLSPECGGGEAAWFSIEPALPEGVKLDESTGEIKGVLRPDVELPETEYVVKCGNSAGETAVTICFSVSVPPPTMLKYYGVKSCFSGEDINWTADYEGGQVKEWSIQPELPKGLQLVQETGAIFGVPTEAAAEQEYVVTATNGGGKATCPIKFAVKLAPPTSIKYPNNKEYYPMGGSIYLQAEVKLLTGEEAKTDSGGSALNKLRQVVSTKIMAKPPSKHRRSVCNRTHLTYVVEPELPEGLTLAERTGVISGMCTTPIEWWTYKVTVSNASGSASCDLPLAIQLIPPTDLSYPEVAKGKDSGMRIAEDGVAYTEAQFIEYMGEEEGKAAWEQAPKYEAGDTFFVGDSMMLTPTVQGLVSEWIVEPALPAGLDLDPQQGIISGTPTEPQTGTWKVTAKNDEGEATCDVALSIVDKPPSDFSYPDLQSVYPLERRMSVYPSVSGKVSEFSVEPALPSGMALDPTTGEISGTPMTAIEETCYTVTAWNDTGSCATEAKFSLQLVPPEDLRYPSADDLYSVGEKVELEPEVIGGANSWTVEPALPDGLSLDPATGLISGTCANIADEVDYTITASNDAGGTSTVITFAVTAPPPSGLSYPELANDYVVGTPMSVEPLLEEGFGVTFSISPALPSGLWLDEKRGVIEGTPEVAAEETTYTVTATNVAGEESCEITFQCSEPPQEQEMSIDQKYAAMIEGITDLADLVALREPGKTSNLSDWMVWMVHRAYLNDPTLTDFNFNNLQMPLPHLEQRVAPKLAKAMEHNTHITSLQLVNSNLQKPSGHDLANSLKRNTTLEILNIEANNVDSEAVRAMAVALKENTDTKMEVFRFSGQKHVGEKFGRPVEEALCELMESNKTICKLGCALHDPHWRDKITRYTMRNVDVARKKRKKKTVKGEEAIPLIEKTLSRCTFKEPPEDAAWEKFEDDDEKLNIARGATSQQKRLPTKEQLQAAAKAAGKPLKYAEVAPLLKDFRLKLFNGALHCVVDIADAYNATYTGQLRGWTEKNENWTIDVFMEEEFKIYRFSLNKQPIVELTDAFAEWLAPSEAA